MVLMNLLLRNFNCFVELANVYENQIEIRWFCIIFGNKSKLIKLLYTLLNIAHMILSWNDFIIELNFMPLCYWFVQCYACMHDQWWMNLSINSIWFQKHKIMVIELAKMIKFIIYVAHTHSFLLPNYFKKPQYKFFSRFVAQNNNQKIFFRTLVRFKLKKKYLYFSLPFLAFPRGNFFVFNSHSTFIQKKWVKMR